MPVRHPKKHDINSDNDHIKDRLDMNGDVTVPDGSKFKAGVMEYNSSGIKYDVTNPIEITFDGNINVNMPNNMSEVNLYYGNHNLFKIIGSNDPSTFPYRFEFGTDNYNNTSIKFGGIIDYILTYEAYIGTSTEGGTTDAVHINDKGEIELLGLAKITREVSKYGYNLIGVSGTYDGLSTTAASTYVLNDFFVTKELSKGSWGASNDALATTIKLGPDVDNQNAALHVVIHYAVSDNSEGDIVLHVGIKRATGSYDEQAIYEIVKPHVNNNQDDRLTIDAIFNTINPQPLDEIGIVVVRDDGNSDDTYGGSVYVSSVGVKYVANKLGGSVE